MLKVKISYCTVGVGGGGVEAGGLREKGGAGGEGVNA